MDEHKENFVGESNDEISSTKDSSILSRMALNDNKAGMQGLDKEKINRIIHENSVGSKFYENERKKDAQVDARIQKLLEQVENLTPEQLETSFSHANAILKKLEASRILSRTIIHIDMDAFYASVEERDNPELKNKPMAVGGMDMLSTSNYIARRYGVRAAMPGFIAKKLCPELVLVPLNFDKYRKESNQMRKILVEYDSNFVPMGLDEAYLDITSYLETRKSIPEADRTFVKIGENEQSNSHQQDEKIVFGVTAQEVVKEMRYRIQKETRLTASAGIAPNTLLAKVASDMNKPNGQYYLEPTRENVMEFIKNLSIRKVSGIGKVSEKMLNALNVKTCQDIYDNRAVLYSVFSSTMSNSLLRICIGIGSTILENDSERKSISTERTFRDISNPEEMYQKCEEICEALEADIKKADVKGMTVTLKIKTASFELYTRSKTLFYPVQCKSEIYPIVADLLKQELAAKKGKLKLRLIGVGLSKFSNAESEVQQKSLDYFIRRGTAKKVSLNKSAEQATTDNDILENKNTGIVVEETSNMTTDYATVSDQSVQLKAKDKHDEDKPLEPIPMNSSLDINCDEETDIIEEYRCPICVTEFKDIAALNQHLDKCVLIQKDVNNSKEPVHLGLTIPTNNNGYTDSANDEITCFTCPLCNATFCCQDITLEKFNAHVDSCLNRKTIMELVRSESNQATSDLKRTKNNSQTMGGPPKKRQKKVSKPFGTLDKYFK